ncbi:hypothetical protein KP509_07G086100 [Ceratopteris richardii]|uniref:Uncharacterized protein n=1 Tax=Ceratopteris richardii TaxID=49495 RepID=A0A8T2UBX5_CERRI|nr:hypothetical protein KP509_07G086100 [Ceratopteris richardii]KAH7433782.1 hypothetical protein KP509_07G086100 [Ceratopteris richardii]
MDASIGVVRCPKFQNCASISSSRTRDYGHGGRELRSSMLGPPVFTPTPNQSQLTSSRSLFLVVRAGKGKRRMGAGIPQPQRVPSLPKIEDDGNPKFVIFVRDKKVPLWFPLNLVTGGSVAKMVVGAMGNEWGKSMAQGTLTRDLGNAIYKDEKSIRMTAMKTHSMLKNATELEYGYKIVDMKNQKSAFMPSDVIKIPPKEELKTVVDKVKNFFGDSFGGMQEAFKGLSSSGQDPESTPKDSK